MNKTTVPVVVSRYIDAPPQRVYDAWLIPQNASKWLFATPTGHMIRAEIDPRIGGKFTLTDKRNSDEVEHTGRFLELLPGHRIVFSYTVPKFSKEATAVRVEISPKGKGSKVTLTVEDVPPELSARTMDGWTQILNGLAKETTTV